MQKLRRFKNVEPNESGEYNGLKKRNFVTEVAVEGPGIVYIEYLFCFVKNIKTEIENLIVAWFRHVLMNACVQTSSVSTASTGVREVWVGNSDGALDGSVRHDGCQQQQQRQRQQRRRSRQSRTSGQRRLLAGFVQRRYSCLRQPGKIQHKQYALPRVCRHFGNDPLLRNPSEQKLAYFRFRKSVIFDFTGLGLKLFILMVVYCSHWRTELNRHSSPMDILVLVSAPDSPAQSKRCNADCLDSSGPKFRTAWRLHCPHKSEFIQHSL